MTEEIEILQELTANLPPFPSPKRETVGVDYELDTGSAIGWYEYENEYLGVHRWLFAKGTVFPDHVHETVEFVYVFAGSFKFTIAGLEQTVKIGDYAVVPPGVLHSATFHKEECLLFTITCPPEQGFPHE